jgi:hypothetical protein
MKYAESNSVALSKALLPSASAFTAEESIVCLINQKNANGCQEDA